MKLKKLLMLAVVAILAVMALVSCDGTPEDSTSKKPDESSSTGPETVTVTFNWGVKVWGEGKDDDEDKPDEYKYSQSFTFEKGDDVKVPQEVKDTLNDVEGYATSTWDVPLRDLRDIQEDAVLNALYDKLELYTYTFKNQNGNVIKTNTAWEGSSIVDEAPSTEAFYYHTSPDSLQDPKEYMVDDQTYYIEAEDLDKLNTHIAVPIGSYFIGWTSSEKGSTLSVLAVNNTVFTVHLGVSETVISYVKPGTITKDNLLNQELYTELDKVSIYKQLIQYGTDTDSKKDFSIIDQYEDQAAAEAAGKGTEYSEALAGWNKYSSGLSSKFYMAWDGEFVYFMAEIKDSKVITQGSAYCVGLDNPYENDGVELWYRFGDDDPLKVGIDACGYTIFGDRYHSSAYLNYMKQQGWAKAKVTDKDGISLDVTTDKSARVIENATGYTVAFAFPAYREDTKGVDLDQKANWGTKVKRGDTFSVSLQVDNLSDIFRPELIQGAIAAGSTGMWSQATSEEQAAINEVFLGAQNARGKGEMRFVLG